MVVAQHKINEFSAITTFAGDYPDIPYYPGVNVELLTVGDADPFFITLEIAEIGRTSANGLLYDQELVEAIVRQLQGLGGIQGHIPEGEESTSYPNDAVDWVGHKLVNGVLWAKGYVPPGDTREQLRRLKARTGKIGTSIYGYGEREYVNEDQTVWRSRNFELHSVDLAQAKMAALQLSGDFHITSETTQATDNPESEANMPDDITITDVPEDVREQIIRQAQLETDAERVSELVEQVADLTNRIAGLETDVEARDTRISELTTELGDRDTLIATYRAAEFSAMLDERIAEATQWQVNDEQKREKLAALRRRLRRDSLAELTDSDPDEAQIEAALQQAFEDNKLIIETIRDALGGPTAGIGGIDTHEPPEGSWETYKEHPEQLTRRWGRTYPNRKTNREVKSWQM